LSIAAAGGACGRLSYALTRRLSQGTQGWYSVRSPILGQGRDLSHYESKATLRNICRGIVGTDYRRAWLQAVDRFDDAFGSSGVDVVADDAHASFVTV